MRREKRKRGHKETLLVVKPDWESFSETDVCCGAISLSEWFSLLGLLMSENRKYKSSD